MVSQRPSSPPAMDSRRATSARRRFWNRSIRLVLRAQHQPAMVAPTDDLDVGEALAVLLRVPDDGLRRAGGAKVDLPTIRDLEDEASVGRDERLGAAGRGPRTGASIDERVRRRVATDVADDEEVRRRIEVDEGVAVATIAAHLRVGEGLPAAVVHAQSQAVAALRSQRARRGEACLVATVDGRRGRAGLGSREPASARLPGGATGRAVSGRGRASFRFGVSPGPTCRRSQFAASLNGSAWTGIAATSSRGCHEDVKRTHRRSWQ